MKRVLAIATILCSLVAVSSPAGAHGQGFPTSFFPEDGGVVAEPPETLEVEFSVVPLRMDATLSNAVGETVDVAATVDGSERVVLTPATPLTPGIWLVAFEVEFDHPDHGASTVAGGWTFVIGSGGALGDVPEIEESTSRWAGLGDLLAILGYVVAVIGVVALIIANRHKPQLAGGAALVVVLGLAPAVAAVVLADAEPVYERTDDVAATLDISDFGTVEATMDRTGGRSWSLQADFTEQRPIAVRVWAAVAEPTSDAGGTPVNQLAFIDTSAGGRFNLDLELDAPGRWQVVLLPSDSTFQSSQGGFWVDQP